MDKHETVVFDKDIGAELQQNPLSATVPAVGSAPTLSCASDLTATMNISIKEDDEIKKDEACEGNDGDEELRDSLDDMDFDDVDFDGNDGAMV
jgi:hypothetical protein